MQSIKDVRLKVKADLAICQFASTYPTEDHMVAGAHPSFHGAVHRSNLEGQATSHAHLHTKKAPGSQWIQTHNLHSGLQ